MCRCNTTEEVVPLAPSLSLTLKAWAKRAFAALGYDVRKLDRRPPSDGRVVQYRYVTADGSFDYESYRRVQEEGNKRKLEHTWVIEENIAFLAEYVKKRIPSPEFGICHGTRRGKEQAWFREHLGCEVIGTEISETATQFPHTIQWDFHETKPEWIGAVDFIYSNALDHSYDAEKCLGAWMRCLKPGGLCFIEHSSLHGPAGASELDPFGAELVQMPFLIATWSKGEYAVLEVIEAPKKYESLETLHFIVLIKP